MLRRQGRIDGHDNRAEQQTGEISHHPFVPVLAEDRHPISTGNSPGVKRFYHAADLGGELLRGNRLPPARGFPQHDVCLVAADNAEKYVVEGLEAHATLPRRNKNKVKVELLFRALSELCGFANDTEVPIKATNYITVNRGRRLV